MSDPVNPGIDPIAGSQVIYSAASGMEKALADVEANRLIATYAELVRDQWDPYAISAQNLGYLAWAMGVNLWEDDWSENFKRWWVANQWWLKSIRGSRPGLDQFVQAVNGKVHRVIAPPATTFPMPKLTDEQRKAYIARFPQLRLYPYFPRKELPYLAFVGPHYNADGSKAYPKNGGFLGPYRKFFPTNTDKGGRWTRTATYWDHGEETQLTFRTTTMVPAGSDQVVTFDEISLPGHVGDKYHIGERDKYLLTPDLSRRNTRHAVFLGRLDPTGSRFVRVPRDGRLDMVQGKAQYQTVMPSVDFIEVYPEHVYETHPRRKTEMYARRKDFLTGKFLPPSNAYLHAYERWYVFDRDRVPDYRKANVFMGYTRLGIPKYTAEAKIEFLNKWPRFMAQTSGYMTGFLHKPDNAGLDKLRRAASASKALRDTILLDTQFKRVVRVSDLRKPDGSFTVGQLIRD